MSSKFKHPGFALVKEKIPYSGKGVDELLSFLRKTMTEPKNKNIVRIFCEAGSGEIYIEKLVPESEAHDTPTLSLHEVIRIQRMDEYEPEKDQSGINHLWDIFSIIHKEGYEVCYLAIGSKAEFQKWLGIRIPVTNMTFFETPVEIIPDLPEDVVIVCGADTKVANYDEIKLSIKMTI
jgi:hypothetical protein